VHLIMKTSRQPVRLHGLVCSENEKICLRVFAFFCSHILRVDDSEHIHIF
jgi:hypothetical protein